MTAEPSTTALMTAVARGRHRLDDPAPWVLDDPYALPLAGEAWPRLNAMVAGLVPEPVLRQCIGLVVGRSRYAEDRVVAGAFAQYVILGAGLDSFAWRRPDLLRSLRVFEVDQAATQQWKRERAQVLALPASDRHVFVPFDLEAASLAAALDDAGLDRSAPTVFSWLGVTTYLTVDAIEATLKVVASCAAGSEVVWTYAPTDEHVDDVGQEMRARLGAVAAAAGEDIGTTFAPDDAESLVTAAGLDVVDHPTRDDLHGRYGITMPTSERVMAARVPR